MKHYFLIETTFTEQHSGYVYVAESLKEAESHIMEFSDWYCANGTATIIEVDCYMHIINEYRYNEGKKVRTRRNKI